MREIDYENNNNIAHIDRSHLNVIQFIMDEKEWDANMG